jgi:protein-L-isoaspartate(D-aspartate) O-methyltransferase
MVQPGGKVVGIEHLPELSAMSTRNLVKDPEHKKMIDDGDLLIVTGDGRKGYPEEGMYFPSHLFHFHPDPALGSWFY